MLQELEYHHLITTVLNDAQIVNVEVEDQVAFSLVVMAQEFDTVCLIIASFLQEEGICLTSLSKFLFFFFLTECQMVLYRRQSSYVGKRIIAKKSVTWQMLQTLVVQYGVCTTCVVVECLDSGLGYICMCIYICMCVCIYIFTCIYIYESFCLKIIVCSVFYFFYFLAVFYWSDGELGCKAFHPNTTAVVFVSSAGDWVCHTCFTRAVYR